MRKWTSNPALKVPRSTFNMNHIVKTAFESGDLVPLPPTEVLPGDTWSMRVNSFLRLATPIKPFMDSLRLTYQFWFVPMRQLWANFEKFMGAQDNPGDSTDFLVPQVVIRKTESPIAIKRMADYFGIPVSNLGAGAQLSVNALPFRAYQRIWDYHYRDQDLQDSFGHPTNDGPDADTSYAIRKRGKRHDYFTSCKPWQQKQEPIPLALGGKAPIGSNYDTGLVGVTNSSSAVVDLRPESSGDNRIQLGVSGVTADRGLFADLGAASGVTITQLRNSIAIQQIFERDARGGTRYAEQLVSRFGVVDPALLVLQQPIYLGGGVSPVAVSPVPQTQASPATDVKPENVQGNLAAVGTSQANGIGFTQSFTEHGYIIPVVSASADLTYQQGLHKMWSRRERFDFYTPELAHVSEQPVFVKEIYATGSAADDNVFGYNGAYDEYRFAVSTIHNRFKSAPLEGQTLDYWHLSQQFQSRPSLNDEFIQDNPPVKRILAVQTEPDFIGDILMTATAARIMPITGIPGLTRI